MAAITTFLFARHVRGEASAQLLYYRVGKLRVSGRGLAFWFWPLGAGLAEVPLDDRDVALVMHGRSSDFQDVVVQGVVTYRVIEPDLLAQRVDFAIDPHKGTYLRQPLDKLVVAVTELAQQLAGSELAVTPLKVALERGAARLRDVVHAGLAQDPGVASLGLEIVSTRISSIKPSPDMEKALGIPTRESIQQSADQATFGRRALAVEKERAIQENELANQIELAKREETLIDQRGRNEQRRATEAAAARKIESDAAVLQQKAQAHAQAEGIRVVELARVESERDRMSIYRDMPTPAVLGLAARELAANLQTIEHLSLGSDMLGPMLSRLISAGTEKLEKGGS